MNRWITRAALLSHQLIPPIIVPLMSKQLLRAKNWMKKQKEISIYKLELGNVWIFTVLTALYPHHSWCFCIKRHKMKVDFCHWKGFNCSLLNSCLNSSKETIQQDLIWHLSVIIHHPDPPLLSFWEVAKTSLAASKSISERDKPCILKSLL